jgi:hypothetical protein
MWRHVAKDLEGYLSRDELHEELQKNFGTFVKYVFYMQPHVWPQHMPAAWNATPD